MKTTLIIRNVDGQSISGFEQLTINEKEDHIDNARALADMIDSKDSVQYLFDRIHLYKIDKANNTINLYYLGDISDVEWDNPNEDDDEKRKAIKVVEEWEHAGTFPYSCLALVNNFHTMIKMFQPAVEPNECFKFFEYKDCSE